MKSVYKKLRQERIEDIYSDVYQLLHTRSGAEILFIHNDDTEKVFSISFRTAPENSGGIPHILEHSVLCGSRKFPVKEPFVELLKGSMKTFLNAFTFPDKTMYPVASTNLKDFTNLVDVYLDAVFYPLAVEDEDIFRQEGWHYEWEDGSERLKISGVVYNEMLGAFGQPEQVLMRHIKESLLPDTPYAHESGGHPDHIRRLEYEEFRAFHKSWYHPSNSRLIVYGDLDPDTFLDWLDENYLSAFEAQVIPDTITLQNPGNLKRDHRFEYPLGADQDEEGKAYFSRNWIVDGPHDSMKGFALELLGQMLLETEAAPLRRMLISEGIAQDVFSSHDSSLRQGLFSIVAKNCMDRDEARFQSLIMDKLQELADKGIDRNLMQSVINSNEFSLREADFGGYPKGLIYAMNVMSAWNHDGDPYEKLKFEEKLSYVKSGLSGRLFEDLIREQLLENTAWNTVTLQPRRGLSEAKQAQLQEELDQLAATLSEAEKISIRDRQQALLLKQRTPDSPENTAKIPRLTLADISREARHFRLQDWKKDLPIHVFPVFSNGICYLRASFVPDVATAEDIPWYALLASLLTKLATDTRSYEALDNDIYIHSGGIHFSFGTRSVWYDTEDFHYTFGFYAKALSSSLGQLRELLEDILFRTRFDDASRLQELINEMLANIESSILASGHAYAETRNAASFSSRAAAREKSSGLSWYLFLRDLKENFAEQHGGIAKKLETLYRNLFVRERAEVFLTCDEQDADAAGEMMSGILSLCSSDASEAACVHPLLLPARQAFILPGDVQYVAKAFQFRNPRENYSGSMQVLKTLLSLDYLWNRIRVQGGAYGAFCQLGRSGNVSFSTYRDPRLRESLDGIDETAYWIGSLEPGPKDLEQVIIGTLSRYDRPLNPSAMGAEAAGRHLLSLDDADIDREREEILSTDGAALRNYADLFREGLNTNSYTVLGSDAKIRQDSDLFSDIISLFGRQD